MRLYSHSHDIKNSLQNATRIFFFLFSFGTERHQIFLLFCQYNLNEANWQLPVKYHILMRKKKAALNVPRLFFNEDNEIFREKFTVVILIGSSHSWLFGEESSKRTVNFIALKSSLFYDISPWKRKKKKLIFHKIQHAIYQNPYNSSSSWLYYISSLLLL